METSKKNSIQVYPKVQQSSSNKHERPSLENQSLIQDIKDMFRIFDSDNDGKISASEVGNLMKALGRDITKEEVEKLIKEIDQNETDTIEETELIKYLLTNYRFDDDYLDEVNSAFKFFDLNNDGKITLVEFKNILLNFGGEFTETEVELMFGELDTLGNGFIKYAEFIELWKYQ